MSRFKRTLIALATVGALLALVGAFTGAANAATSDQPKAEVVEQSTNASVIGAKANATDIVTGKVTVLAYGFARGLTKAQMKKASRCYTLAVGTPFINSGKNASGQWKYFSDTAKPGQNKFCEFVGEGGKKYTLKANCGNRAFTKRLPPGIKLVKGQVLLVRSFASVRVRLSAYAKVRVTAVCGYAEAQAEATVMIWLKQYIRSRGAAANRLFASVAGKATAKASASLSCVDAPPPTDVCPNISGVQTSVPPGMILENGKCVTPPPNSYSASGSTSVQDQKTLYENCPAPNQSIQKSGSSDLKKIDSPVFTETSTVSQADAQRKLDARLAEWRAQNQPVVDGQAQAQAQDRLNTALLSCPQTPPPSPVGCSASVLLQKDGRTVSLSVSTSGPVVSTTISWGDGATSSGTSASHFYTSDATFTITVTVTGDKGQTASCTTSVTTKQDSGPPPPP